MSKVKYDILCDALRRIALASGSSNPIELATIASTAIKDAAQVIEYCIAARTWYGSNGGEFKARLYNVITGATICEVAGSTWGSDAWAYDMRNRMHSQRPDLFPAHNGMHPTIYFREVCKVDYSHTEVTRKRDL